MNSKVSNKQDIYLKSKDKINLDMLYNLTNQINNTLKLINQKQTLKYKKQNFKNKTHLIKYHKLHNNQLLMSLKNEIINGGNLI
jgi:hypothetical protein